MMNNVKGTFSIQEYLDALDCQGSDAQGNVERCKKKANLCCAKGSVVLDCFQAIEEYWKSRKENVNEKRQEQVLSLLECIVNINTCASNKNYVGERDAYRGLIALFSNTNKSIRMLSGSQLKKCLSSEREKRLKDECHDAVLRSEGKRPGLSKLLLQLLKLPKNTKGVAADSQRLERELTRIIEYLQNMESQPVLKKTDVERQNIVSVLTDVSLKNQEMVGLIHKHLGEIEKDLALSVEKEQHQASATRQAHEQGIQSSIEPNTELHQASDRLTVKTNNLKVWIGNSDSFGFNGGEGTREASHIDGGSLYVFLLRWPALCKPLRDAEALLEAVANKDPKRYRKDDWEQYYKKQLALVNCLEGAKTKEKSLRMIYFDNKARPYLEGFQANFDAKLTSLNGMQGLGELLACYQAYCEEAGKIEQHILFDSDRRLSEFSEKQQEMRSKLTVKAGEIDTSVKKEIEKVAIGMAKLLCDHVLPKIDQGVQAKGGGRKINESVQRYLEDLSKRLQQIILPLADYVSGETFLPGETREQSIQRWCTKHKEIKSALASNRVWLKENNPPRSTQPIWDQFATFCRRMRNIMSSKPDLPLIELKRRKYARVVARHDVATCAHRTMQSLIGNPIFCSKPDINRERNNDDDFLAPDRARLGG